MSYEKHTWETGEVITAEKLNNMEKGITDSYSNVYCIPGMYDNGDTLDSDILETIAAVGGDGGLIVMNISSTEDYGSGVYLSVPGSFGFEFYDAFNPEHHAEINETTGLIEVSSLS